MVTFVIALVTCLVLLWLVMRVVLDFLTFNVAG